MRFFNLAILHICRPPPLQLHAILSDISPPLTHGSVAVAVLQVAVAVVGMLWAARTASKAR